MDINEAAVESLVIQRIRSVADTNQLTPCREQAAAAAAICRQACNLDVVRTMVPVKRVDMGTLQCWLITMVTAGTKDHGTFFQNRPCIRYFNQCELRQVCSLCTAYSTPQRHPNTPNPHLNIFENCKNTKLA